MPNRIRVGLGGQTNIQSILTVTNYESELGSVKIVMIERAHGGHG